MKGAKVRQYIQLRGDGAAGKAELQAIVLMSSLLPENARRANICSLNTGFTSQLRRTLGTVHLALSSYLTYFPNVFEKEVN